MYSALLVRLSLSEAHRADLQRRGLPDAEIDRRGYRTLPMQGRSKLANKLREQFGDSVLSLPGLVTKEGTNGRYLTLAGRAGLLVPVRNLGGQVIALLTRRDDANDGRGKYVYLSSVKHGGPGPGAPVHVPLGITAPTNIIRVTEGALKGDVAHALSGLPTIGLPGLSSWRPVLPILRGLGCRTVRLALDADAKDNATAARALEALARVLDAEGLAVELERWPEQHKGIDDALAAGVAVEVLAGDVAQAIAEIVAEGTVAEPPQEATALERLEDVLTKSSGALFEDRELLRALAQLAETDAAEYACRRARLGAAGVRLRDLERALAPLRSEIRRDRPALDAAGCYRVSGGRIVRDVATHEGGTVELPLATWHGRIVEETIHDDGAEQSVSLAVEGALADGTPLPRVEIRADDWPYMRWPLERWGTRAVVLAGAGTADHLRCALQLLSGDVPRHTVYTHTGWREVGSGWLYVHGAGAISADGQASDIAVSLPDALTGYILPKPPTGHALAEAIRASLTILEVAPDRITVPLMGGLFRAVLGPADYALHLAGPTGVGKTELAALVQQHHGAGLDARHLPGSWTSTGNAIEGLAFAAKDAILAVDDFAPGGTVAEAARMHREAGRVLRAQGNRAGRLRMRADTTLRPAKPPRGMILSTGEDVPRGASLRARLLVLEVGPGELDFSRLTPCQRDAADGRYAEALAGYLRWLAPQYQAILDGLREKTAELRDRARAEGLHARTPGIIADLATGWRCWLDYALAAGAIDLATRDALARRVWRALGEAGATQADHVAAADPVEQFLRLLSAALASGRAHIADSTGDAPKHAAAWGWREREIGAGEFIRAEWQPQGRRIGWVDGENLYLEPEAAFAEAQSLASIQGDSVPVSSRTLHKRLKDRCLLVSTEPGKLLTRRTVEGQRRIVIHLATGAISHGQGESGEQGQAPQKSLHS
jgi:hypothetical protein